MKNLPLAPLRSIQLNSFIKVQKFLAGDLVPMISNCWLQAMRGAFTMPLRSILQVAKKSQGQIQQKMRHLRHPMFPEAVILFIARTKEEMKFHTSI